MSAGGSLDRRLAFIAVVCLLAVGAALVSQHVFDMQPCPWCILQRLIFVVIAVVCGVGLLIRGAAGRVFGGGLALLLSIAGFASAMWQHFVAAASDSCNLTLADRIMNSTSLDGLLPEIFQARATCAEAAVSLLGVPYAFWSAALFVVIALLSLAVVRTKTVRRFPR